ncbi:MAG: hypothetical protein ABW148_18420, partial [Sedimenticola sp.]
WQLAVGSWQLAVGSWQLAVGSWQLAVGKKDIPSSNHMPTLNSPHPYLERLKIPPFLTSQ